LPKAIHLNWLDKFWPIVVQGCHSGNNPQGGLDFTNVCDILNHWQRIDARAVQGIPSPMPQAGLIPQEERSKIIEWLNTGHSYSN
jgi:uncharacterized membrane protein